MLISLVPLLVSVEKSANNIKHSMKNCILFCLFMIADGYLYGEIISFLDQLLPFEKADKLSGTKVQFHIWMWRIKFQGQKNCCDFNFLMTISRKGN